MSLGSIGFEPTPGFGPIPGFADDFSQAIDESRRDPGEGGDPGEESADSSATARTSCWPHASALHDKLDRLTERPEANLWAERCLVALDRLAESPSFDGDDSRAALQRLGQLTDEALSPKLSLPAGETRELVVSTAHELARRLAIWSLVAKAAAGETPWRLSGEAAFDLGAWHRELAGLSASLGDSAEGRRWANYLLLDAAASVSASDQPAARKLARRILSRLASPDLTAGQTAWLARKTASMAVELRRMADEPIAYDAVLRELEEFEFDPTGPAQAPFAESYQKLKWSSDPANRDLAREIDVYYRNANVRIAVRSELVERFIPQTAPERIPVRDSILGAEVRGQSLTNTQVSLRLAPDPQNIRMRVEVAGDVASNTVASIGPAKFYNDGDSRFLATKEIVLNAGGVKTGETLVRARDFSEVADVKTSYDSIPFLSDLARSIALKQRAEQESDIAFEVESRVAAHAKSRLDEEVALRLTTAEKKFSQEVLAPLRRLNLQPAAIGTSSTSERLYLFGRLAADHQFSALTGRPQAPADSLASAQLHETTINNWLDQLRLGGRRAELPVLLREIGMAINGKAIELPPEVADELPEGVEVEFAENEPVRITFEDGVVALRLSIVELSAGDQSWYDFTVIVRFEPTLDGMQVTLSRTGHIELIGRGGRVTLRVIFSKVFSTGRAIPLLPAHIADDARLANLEVTQCVAQDGWLGLALGPARLVTRRASETR
jgi:hypothetical protein